jgi:uncharacterized protein (DUF1330 family)
MGKRIIRNTNGGGSQQTPQCVGTVSQADPTDFHRLCPGGEKFPVPSGRSTRSETPECYARYAKALLPVLIRAGGRPSGVRRSGNVLIGPDSEGWDEVVVVGYPSLAAFERMIADPGYEACARLRAEALCCRLVR